MDLSGKKRVVIKVGTSNIAYKTGHLNIRRVERLVRVFSDIYNSGREIIFVTSGAIGVGMGRMNLRERPSDMPSRQACAAVGQCALMNIYDNEFSKYNRTIAQVLMTRDVVSNSERRQNAENTLEKLIEMGVIPIINANDTISLENLDFDENDTLSAAVARLVNADLLIIFTDVDGLYLNYPPAPGEKHISLVRRITDDMIYAARGKGSELASGGMLSKLEAAMLAMECKIPTVIIKGEKPEILYDLFDNKAVCTIFSEE